MSCTSSSFKISRLVARLATGISALTSQRAFFAGLALAGAGTTVAGLLATLRRTRAKGEPSPRLVDVRHVPQLTPRPAVSPVRPGENSRCAECGSGDKDGPWYRLDGQLYCRDCARGVAKTLDVDLTLAPEPAPTPNGSSGPAVAPLSPERRRSTRLLPSRVRVRLGDGAQGPQFGIVENGWVVVDQRGFDTGLAVTPTLRTEANGAVAAEPGRWRLTHIDSGKALDGVYGSPEEAQAVAGILAQIDWTKPERELTEAEINRARATIRAYRQAVREVGSASAEPAPKPAPSVATRPPTDLTGRLIADRYGGLARVLADSGETLLACDSLGQRYEVARHKELNHGDTEDTEFSKIFLCVLRASVVNVLLEKQESLWRDAMPTTVFISSTSRDLLEHRAAVAQALLNAGFHPIDMANFMARPSGATEACLKEVAEADLFVGIYAWRYGFIPPGAAVSITEQEFLEAERRRKPCFIFMVEERHPWPDEFKEGGLGGRLLAEFKARLDGKLVRTTFTGPEDLAMKLLASLQRHERDRPRPADPRSASTPPAAASDQPSQQIGGVNISGISGGSISVGNIEAGVRAGGDIVGGDKRMVNTGGGAYIAGRVETGGGAFVGRDQVVHQAVGGSAANGSALADLEAALVAWKQEIEAKLATLTELDGAEKAEVKTKAGQVEAEAVKGETANVGKIERLLNTMSSMAPDILEVTATTLQNPFRGVGLVLQKINDRVKLEREAGDNNE